METIMKREKKRWMENYKQISSALKKGSIVAFEDETTHHNTETLYSQVHEF